MDGGAWIIVVIASIGGPMPPWLEGAEFVPKCDSVKCSQVALLECELVVHSYVQQFGIRRLKCSWETR